MINILDYGWNPQQSNKVLVQEQEFRQLQDLGDLSTPEERKEFIRLVRDQEIDIEDALEVLSNDAQQVIKDNSAQGKLKDKKEVIALLTILLSQYTDDLTGILKSNNKMAAGVGAAFSFNKVVDALGDEDDLIDSLQEFQKKVESYPDKIAKEFLTRKFPTDGISVGERIVTIKGNSLEVVKAIIGVGIDEGHSADRIAFNIDAFLKGGDAARGPTPFEWIKNAEGIIKLKKLETIPRGTISSNSIRIGRTEINNTFRQSSLDLNKDQPWFGGIIWHLSASHLGVDICDDFAAGSPYKAEDVPSSHPYCMCWTSTVILPYQTSIGSFVQL